MSSPSLTTSDVAQPGPGAAGPTGDGFQVWDAADAQQSARWLRLWQTLPSQDIHSHPHYVRLFCGPADRAVCAAWDSPRGKILFPFTFRDLTAEPYCPADLRPASDLTTPYGYGGSACWDCLAPASLAGDFWSAFDHWAQGQRLVSQFVRISLFDGETLPYCGPVTENRKVVICDLRPPEQQVVRQFSRNARYNLRKAGRFGLRVECDEQGARLPEFLAIYEHTMRRKQAESSYFFPAEFFQRLHAGLAGRFAYFHVWQGDQVVSTELLLLTAQAVYSFLGGTYHEAFNTGANYLLKAEVIRWAAARGKRWYVLGGGYRPDDGIFQYKQGFAPDGIWSFRVGTRLHDAAASRRLVEARRRLYEQRGEAWKPQSDFFPPYRA